MINKKFFSLLSMFFFSIALINCGSNLIDTGNNNSSASVNEQNSNLSNQQNYNRTLVSYTTASDAVSPTVTGATLFNYTSSGSVAIAVNFIGNNGENNYSVNSTNATSIYDAQTQNNATAGYQCFIFYDGTINNSRPSWYTATLPTTYTSSTNFSPAQLTSYGFAEPTTYAQAQALFQNAQTTTTLAAISKSNASGESTYYVTTGSYNLGFFNCYTLLNYNTTNWGGSSSSNTVNTTTVSPDWAHSAWFVIFGNDLNTAGTAQSADAYTVLKISAVSGE